MDGLHMMHFCTLFDQRYACRALVMLESLERHCKSHRFDVTILAMDREVHSIVQSFKRPHWRVLSVSDLGDSELCRLEKTRPRREFCWTAAPALCSHLVSSLQPEDYVFYVDADMEFFLDPGVLLAETSQADCIFIHEHRFSPDMIEQESVSGRFNVGLVGFRVRDEAINCVKRWREQVIESCEMDPTNGSCGDQIYLNEWPKTYRGVRVLENIGAGVGPWNVNAYQVSDFASSFAVDGVPVVFFHFHAFRVVAAFPIGPTMIRPAYGYRFSRAAVNSIFKPYAKRISNMSSRLRDLGFIVEPDERASVRQAVGGIARGDIVFV